MAGNTYIGHGTSFNLQQGTSPTFTYLPIDGVSDISFGSNKIDATDCTDMTTTGTVRVYQPGLENPGECSLKVMHKPGNTSQAALIAAKDSTIHTFRVIYTPAAGGGHDDFSGIIVGIDKAIPDDKPATLSCKIQITGPVVYTSGS